MDGPPPDLVRLPLVYQGEDIGEPGAGPACWGEFFSKADMDLLRSIAHEAGMAAHSRASRPTFNAPRRLVTARGEERRRLRRDLHDGLGPVLGVAYAQTGRRPQPPDRRSRSGVGQAAWLISRTPSPRWQTSAAPSTSCVPRAR